MTIRRNLILLCEIYSTSKKHIKCKINLRCRLSFKAKRSWPAVILLLYFYPEGYQDMNITKDWK